jgi:hypothetical protein
LLAAGSTAEGEAVGGSQTALYLPSDVRLGWHEIDQAVWIKDEAAFDVVTLPIDGPARAYRVPLAVPGRLPELVRERVTSTIVANQHIPFEGRRGVRIVARRQPSGADLGWVVVYDKGIDGDSPDVRQRVRDELAALRSNLGV